MTFGPSPAAQARLEREKACYPHFVKRFEEALRTWFEKDTARRKEKGEKIWHEDFNDFLRSYYRGFKGRGW